MIEVFVLILITHSSSDAPNRDGLEAFCFLSVTLRLIELGHRWWTSVQQHVMHKVLVLDHWFYLWMKNGKNIFKEMSVRFIQINQTCKRN